MKHAVYFLILTLLGLCSINLKAYCQQTEVVNWITFNQLNDSLTVKPKKVFVSFYTDWCTFCKQMDENTFTDQKVIKALNKDYYAVKMDAESADTIQFGNQIFTNKRLKRVNPLHEIALLLASRKDKIFTLPAMIIFDEKFVAEKRYFQYIDPKNFYQIISE